MVVRNVRHIHKFFHEYSSSDFEKLYLERFNYDSTKRFGLHIKPMDQPNVYELYYVPSNKMLKMVSQLYMISRDFNNTFNKLPNVARNQFINECIVEELFNTNELEGIRSSREEIARSTREIVFNNKKSKKRFESMIKSYLRLLTNDYQLPKDSKDIRKIYDDITNGEIETEELPDGEIFRKEVTYILKKSGTGKVVHHGITPESEIIKLTEKLLGFMNDNHEIPNLIKVAIGHYYFGYLHPFYDGNGRTSRFISSMFLSKDLGIISTLSLSRGCNQHRNKYLEAFEITNSFKGKGEMNSFIETFLEIIIEALKKMNIDLKEKNELLNIALKKLENEPKLKNMTKVHREVMFVLAQNHFFDSSSGLTVSDLAGIFEKSDATIRKIVKELLSLSLLEKRGERPVYFCIKNKYFED